MEREAEAKDNLWRARLDAVLMHRIWGSLYFPGHRLYYFLPELRYRGSSGQAHPDGHPAVQRLGLPHAGTVAPPAIPAGEGVVGGVGGVLAFLPNVVLLFGAITVLENSGYMMRVSRLMSRIMKIMGLNGSSFAPSCWDSAVRFPPSCPPGELKRAATAWSPSPCCP